MDDAGFVIVQAEILRRSLAVKNFNALHDFVDAFHDLLAVRFGHHILFYPVQFFTGFEKFQCQVVGLGVQGFDIGTDGLDFLLKLRAGNGLIIGFGTRHTGILAEQAASIKVFKATKMSPPLNVYVP